MKNKRILVGVSASVAAYRACDLVSEFRKKGIEVTVVLTKDARHFVSPLTLEALSNSPVYLDMFSLEANARLPIHIELAESANLVLIAPATADLIAKMAGGFGDELLTCVLLATRAPVLVVPAMNENMYRNRFVQENIQKLKNAHFHLMEPIRGRLACSDDAFGHIPDTQDIVSRALSLLK